MPVLESLDLLVHSLRGYWITHCTQACVLVFTISPWVVLWIEERQALHVVIEQDRVCNNLHVRCIEWNHALYSLIQTAKCILWLQVIVAREKFKVFHNTFGSQTQLTFSLDQGAGVGKGRQIAAVVKEFKKTGGERILWLSTSTDLRYDACRDLKDMQSEDIPVFPQVWMCGSVLSQSKIFTKGTFQDLLRLALSYVHTCVWPCETNLYIQQIDCMQFVSQRRFL